jgi:dsRNA-specific ribonuclease
MKLFYLGDIIGTGLAILIMAVICSLIIDSGFTKYEDTVSGVVMDRFAHSQKDGSPGDLVLLIQTPTTAKLVKVTPQQWVQIKNGQTVQLDVGFTYLYKGERFRIAE